jgi:hypothetical protein
MIARLPRDKYYYTISLGIIGAAAIIAVIAMMLPIQYVVIPIVLVIAGIFF